MDWLELQRKVKDLIRKYRYVAFVLAIGLALMLLPGGNSVQEKSVVPSTEHETPSPKSLQDSLAEILCRMEGAGKVQVLLSQSAGERTIYQTDESKTTSDTAGDIHRETVIVSGSDRTETGLVQQVQSPVYLGAVVLCQGADSPSVRLAIVEAVSKATGLTSDRISVLKMK